ncbi:hypothetical protein AGMMS49975_24880 [Clostridia bacterium]|nr:hypothetical protein AGMMS49975_24880 [Clostridia bacterium]
MDFANVVKNLTDKMIISNTILFFSRFEIEFTKTMIQNYTRIGLLPKLSANRYYTRKHLVILYLINSLKTAYSLEEISRLLREMIDRFEDFSLDKFLCILKEYIHEREIYAETKPPLNQAAVTVKSKETSLL